MPPLEHAEPIWQAVSFVDVSRQQTAPAPQVLGRHSPPEVLELELDAALLSEPFADVAWLLALVWLELAPELDDAPLLELPVV